MSATATLMKLSDFEDYAKKLLPEIKRRYDRAVNRDLSRQQWDGVFKRNTTAVLQQVYEETLDLLRQGNIDSEEWRGGVGMVNRVLQAFDTLIDELIQYALQKHRSSCALSNFPDEHNPSQVYIDEVIELVRKDWSEFAERLATLMPG